MKTQVSGSPKLLRCHLRAAGARYHIWRGWPSSKPVGRYLGRTWPSAAGPVGRIPPVPRQMFRNGCFGGFGPVQPRAAVLFAHILGSGSPRLGKLPVPGGHQKRKPGRSSSQPRAEEHDVQRARGQQHEHQRDLQAVAGEFENRPHLRMMERVRARVSGDIFAFGGEGFRTRLRVDSLKPQREKAPEGAAHDPPKCERFGAKIMRPSNSLRARSFVDRALKSHIPHQGKLVRNSSACVLSALR